jgi:hypothetical protein
MCHCQRSGRIILKWILRTVLTRPDWTDLVHDRGHWRAFVSTVVYVFVLAD